jgi:hypothetical protein
MRRLARRFNADWLRRQLTKMMGKTAAEWTVWIRFPSPELVDAICQMQGIQVVYEPIDLYSAAEDLTVEQAQSICEAEARLIRRATVVTGGRQLAERFREAEGGSHWLPFGTDLHQRATDRGVSARIARPRLGLVGCLDWRVDEYLLVTIMTEHPDWQLILAGPRIHPWGSRLKRLPNVQWFGRIPAERVRSVIRACDVTLIPYRLTDWTRHCLPVKVFEYLAEGKPVVATPLPELELVGDEVAIVSPNAFGEAVGAALGDQSVRAQELRRTAADRFTLQDRARSAIELIEGKTLEAVAR